MSKASASSECASFFRRWARRAAIAALPLVLAGCVTSKPLATAEPPKAQPAPAFAPAPAPIASIGPAFGEPGNAERYGDSLTASEPYPVKAINTEKVKPEFLRQTVPNTTGEPAGTIVIVPSERHLYLVQDDGTALRYGVGVGREGFGWSGEAYIRRKLEWPDWHPPAEMVARDPHARPYANGMPGGPGNPLGARSMTLWQGDKDTLYRIHGTIEPYSIGKAVSSGCIRMMNQDVIDLYDRVPLGTKVVVRS